MNVKDTSKLGYALFIRRYKTNFEYEKYLDVITNKVIRRNLTCFRLNADSLEIEVGRYKNAPCAKPLCKCCNFKILMWLNRNTVPYKVFQNISI